MSSAFSIALSALNADTTAVDVVGNNLANLNTTGFKTSDVCFQDLVNEALNASHNEPGFGVAPPTITQIYSQGAIQTSNGQYDAAIQGDGFFMVNSNGTEMYTRNGNFTVDANGNLLTSTGQNVQGWSSTTGAASTTGPIGNIVLPGGLLRQPVATQNMAAQINLQSGQGVGTTFSTPMVIYDSLGDTHVVTLQFQETAPGAWTYTASIDGGDLAGGTAGTPSTLATGSMTFDSSGNLLTPAPPPPAANASIPLTIPPLADGAAAASGPPFVVNWNIYDPTTYAPAMTQVNENSAASDPTQDGSNAAQVSSISIGSHGEILAQYSNAQPVVVAQLALATFRNPESLIPVGDGNLVAGAATSLASTGTPNTGDRGDIVGGALEASTVDIATEFTNLIVYQRSYEANAKVITTADTLSQDTIAIMPAA